MFWTHDGKPVNIRGLYNGPAFLCCSGPSILDLNLSEIARPGYFKLAVNNAPVALRKHGGFSPQAWTMTDDVKNFCKSIYLDPTIVKFLPDGKPKHKLWNNVAWKEDKKRVRECPGVIYYRRPPGLEEFFDPATFFTDDRFCWGNHKNRCACGFIKEDGDSKKCPKCGSTNRWGSRSCMLVAVRLLVELGFDTLFLLGCDFRMEGGRANYAFEQDRSSGAIRNNNNTYRMLNERFDALRPVMEARGVKVWNCYKDSGLKSFDYMSYSDAVQMCSVVPENDPTEGLYDRKAREKAARKASKGQRRGMAPPAPDAPRTLLERLRMAQMAPGGE
jgi:hypothetical protein